MANAWIRPGGVYTEVGSGGVAAPSVGYVTESASAPAVGSISITEITALRVFEGAAGSAQVTLSGSHTGATDTIEYRIEIFGGAAVTSWSTLQASVDEGEFSGTVTVPRGGWYVARVRKAASTSTEDVQAQKWGVGVIVGGMGQSQIVNWYTNGPGMASVDDRAVYHDGTAWTQMPTSGRGRAAFANALIGLMDCPVAVVAKGYGGSQIEQWYDATTGKKTYYDQWEEMATAAGGKLSAFIWWQCEGDVLLERTKAAYLEDLTGLFAQLRTDYNANLPIVFLHLGTCTEPTPDDAAFERIRDAQVDMSDNSPYNYGMSTIGFARADSIHFDYTSLELLGIRQAQCIAHAYGFATYARNPRISGATLNGSIIDVRVIHDGGTDITPTTGITGFAVLDNGTPATISSAARLNANTVRLTLASAPTGPVTVRYGYGKLPDVSNILRDNSGLSLSLMTTDADVVAQGRKVLLNCIQRVGGAAAASVTGLRWAFFDQSVPNALTAPVVTGTGESTDGSGVLEIDVIGTTLNVGDTGYLVTDTASGIGFCGPVTVSG